MKNYLKNEIKHLPFTIILFVLLYSITAFATGTTLFASSEVKYNNSTSGIQSDKVQGAIDELYACASNYGAYNTRLTNTENTIGSGSLTTTSNTLIGGVNELNGKLTSIVEKQPIVSVTANGVKTYEQVFNELYNAVSDHNIVNGLRIDLSQTSAMFYTLLQTHSNYLNFGRHNVTDNSFQIDIAQLKATRSTLYRYNGSSYIDKTTEVPTNGWVFSVI